MLRGLPNDVYFTVGLITIIGLAAKDAILIVEFAKDLRKDGKPLVDATIEACRLRFRPILMTGLAFICGVLPMAIARGAGGASQQSLGTVVMGGMIAVMILALLMVPSFQCSVGWREIGRRSRGRAARCMGRQRRCDQRDNLCDIYEALRTIARRRKRSSIEAASCLIPNETAWTNHSKCQSKTERYAARNIVDWVTPSKTAAAEIRTKFSLM
jgi:hypothetical protein